MANKKYTLYFKGINKYGHEHNFPIISLNLKSMDEYTSNYDCYKSLFNSLPNEIKKYIKDNLGSMIDFDNENSLSEHFFITDSDFAPIMQVLFENDIDVLYIDQDELTNLIISEKMTRLELQTIKLKSSLNKAKNKYEFFKYLYETYVKDQKVACMIDVYDANREFSNLSYDELMIAAIATDKDNIKVLCKKLGQNLESRRNLAFRFKKLFSIINDKNSRITSFSSVNKRKNANINSKELYDNMIENLNSFSKKYSKEYHE